MYDSSEQEYTPTEARLRERVKGSLGEYSHEFGIDGEAAMDAWIDQALAERDNRVRADERAKRPDLPCDRGCNVNDGPMEDCSQHGRSPRDLWGIIEDQSQRLAAEPAKRPDREQLARIQFEIDNVHQIHGETCLCGFKSSRSRSRTEHLTALFADAVLSSFALEPEAREDAEYFRDGDGDLWKFTDKGEWFHEEEPGEFRQLLSIDAEDQTLTPVSHAELAPAPEAREETGPALRIDDDGAHIYWADPVEGCWVAFRRVDCVGEEELPERRLPAPEAREIPDAEVAAAYSAFVQASFGFPGAPAMRAALEAAREVSRG